MPCSVSKAGKNVERASGKGYESSPTWDSVLDGKLVNVDPTAGRRRR